MQDGPPAEETSGVCVWQDYICMQNVQVLRYTHASSYVAGGGEDAIGKVLDRKVALCRHFDEGHLDHAHAHQHHIPRDAEQNFTQPHPHFS